MTDFKKSKKKKKMQPKNKSKIKNKLQVKHKFQSVDQSQIMHRLFLYNIMLIGLIGLLTWIGFDFFPAIPGNTEDLRPEYLHLVQPKPVEKTIFLMSALLVPFFSLNYTLINKVRPNNSVTLPHLIPPVLIGCLFFLFLYKSDFLDIIFTGFLGQPLDSSISFLCFFSIAFILSTLLYKLKCNQHVFSDAFFYRKINRVFILSALAFIWSIWRIYGIESVDHAGRYIDHFETVLYPLSQTVQGKTLLVDLPSLYGFYPQILAPIFKITGLSVFKFSLLMALLHITALTALLYVLSKLVKSQTLFFLGGITLIILTSGNVTYLLGYKDPYYQYWPIRFVFPAVSVFLVYCFCKKKSITKSIIISLVSSIAIIWNLDTGLFVYLSYGGYLFVRYLFCFFNQSPSKSSSLQWNKKEFILALIAHMATLIITIYLFGLFLQISSGGPINYHWIYSYQAIFYKLGYFMIPIPRTVHPWMLVISAYIYGMIFSLSSFKSNPNAKTEVLFYLSILGVGIFTYYEGRSHVFNLFSVVWPAVIISIFFADQIIRSLRLKLIHLVNIIFPFLIITVFLICTALFFSSIPAVFLNINNQLNNRGKFVSSLTLSELEFIKTNTHKGQACLLLMKNHASYYAEAELVSPISGPGLVESFLKSDVYSLINQVINKRPDCVFLGRNESAVNLGFNYDELFNRYVFVKRNKENTLDLLQPM